MVLIGLVSHFEDWGNSNYTEFEYCDLRFVVLTKYFHYFDETRVLVCLNSNFLLEKIVFEWEKRDVHY